MKSIHVAADDGIAAKIFSFSGVCALCRPDKDVDQMFIAPVNKRGDGTIIEIIQSSADERKTLRGEILYVRRKIEFAVGARSTLANWTSKGGCPSPTLNS